MAIIRMTDKGLEVIFFMIRFYKKKYEPLFEIRIGVCIFGDLLRWDCNVRKTTLTNYKLILLIMKPRGPCFYSRAGFKISLIRAFPTVHQRKPGRLKDAALYADRPTSLFCEASS